MRTFKSLTLAAGALAGILGLASAGQNAVAFPAFAPDAASASLLHRVVEARKYSDPNGGNFYGGYAPGGYAQDGYAQGGYYAGGQSYAVPRGRAFNGDDDAYDPAAAAYGPWYSTNGGIKPYAGGYDFDRYPPGSAAAEQLRNRRFEFCESSPSRC